MKEFSIRKEDGKLIAEAKNDGFDDCLLTSRNGRQRTSFPINPELAGMIIEVLQEYLVQKKQNIEND